MKAYYKGLVLRIAGIVCIALILSVAAAYQKTGICVLAFLLLVVLTYNLIRFHQKTLEAVRRFINAVRFSEFNVSFTSSNKKKYNGLPDSLNKEMEHAILHFNERMLAREGEAGFYSILLNRIDFSILVVSLNDEIRWINKKALDLLGKPQAKTLEELASGYPELREILQKISPQEAKTFRLRQENSEQNIAITTVTATIRGEEMRIFSLKNIQSVVDDTESDAWKKLIRVLTHEMMNSITPIISLAETFSDVERANEPELMNKAMQTIHCRSKGLIRFIHNYRRLTNLPEPKIEKVSLLEIIEDIHRLLKAQGIIFTYQLPPELLITVDRGQMEQVFINLFRNAWEACSFRDAPQVSFTAARDEYNRPLIQISDNGKGISPDIIDKIFIPFFTTKPEGSGIGLSLCRQIISAHHGRLTLTTQPEEGTTFVIRL